MLLNSCLFYIWQHFVSGWGPVKGGWGGIASLPENIFHSDLWEIYNMEFSLYTRVPSPRLFFYIVRKWKCEKLFYLEMLRSHENLIFSFFCLIIIYHVLVYHFLSSYDPKSSKMLMTWIGALLSAWYCQWAPEMKMMKGRQGRVSRAEHHLLAVTGTKIKTWGAFGWGVGKHCFVTQTDELLQRQIN